MICIRNAQSVSAAKNPKPKISELRVQVVHIWDDALGDPSRDYTGNITGAYRFVINTLRREYGLFELAVTFGDDELTELREFFLKTPDRERALDVIELTFMIIDRGTRAWDYNHQQDANGIADRAIEELNGRFKEHGVGYCYSDGKIMRVDSELVHSEVVKPALTVLRRKEYANAQEEYLAAHEHYRHGRNSEALVECCKAFESTMKVICKKRGWTFDETKGATSLVETCLSNGLIPSYWQSHFSGLRSVLKSAIPTPRNKQSGHGAGAGPAKDPPEELTAYVLHMTAATILFLAEAERNLP